MTLNYNNTHNNIDAVYILTYTGVYTDIIRIIVRVTRTELRVTRYNELLC